MTSPVSKRSLDRQLSPSLSKEHRSDLRTVNHEQETARDHKGTARKVYQFIGTDISTLLSQCMDSPERTKRTFHTTCNGVQPTNV